MSLSKRLYEENQNKKVIMDAIEYGYTLEKLYKKFGRAAVDSTIEELEGTTFLEDNDFEY